ncbi:MAG: coproporphyrinogen dehydrogenase HemZ [Eubacterium sp.]|nr:coproporphyrinogen dehydrogenase HemZ [Eubacterium sp.]
MKISMIINDESFEYDVYGLVKAFFPEADVKKETEGENYVKTVTEDEKDALLISVFCDIEGKSAKGEKRVSDNQRKEVKNTLKRLLYTALEEVTEKTLPWGTLTGIRPTKLATALVEKNISDDDIIKRLKEEYFISDKKAHLSLGIAHKENEILKKIDYKNGYSLYVGIPFCPTTCLYCSFSTFPIASWKDKVDLYLDALEKEMAASSGLMQNKKLQSIYIGGGTPTSLNEKQLLRVLEMTEKYFDTSAILEWTLEAGRPDSLNKEKLEIIKASKADRISINPQTMNDETLKLIGRHHTSEDVAEKFELAKKCGIDNINTDIILGLPGEGKDELLYTLEEIKKLAPESLTVHSLAIKRAARLAKDTEKYINRAYDAEEAMQLSGEAAFDMGMAPYYLYRQKNMTGNLENIGFSKEGKEGLYNILIMEEKQTILACGAGSVTKVLNGAKPERIENVKDVNFYIGRIDEMIERKQRKLGISDIDN